MTNPFERSHLDDEHDANYRATMSHIPDELLSAFLLEARQLKDGADRLHAILNNPEELRQMHDEPGEYNRIIRQCLQAVVNLQDAVYPTRPFVDVERDGFEFRSGDIGYVLTVDRL